MSTILLPFLITISIEGGTALVVNTWCWFHIWLVVLSSFLLKLQLTWCSLLQEQLLLLHVRQMWCGSRVESKPQRLSNFPCPFYNLSSFLYQDVTFLEFKTMSSHCSMNFLPKEILIICHGINYSSSPTNVQVTIKSPY